ncbi:MAG: VWA domain-containing protein, partial [bacterium]|nr:VWA domain-containing protein [bacterium]
SMAAVVDGGRTKMDLANIGTVQVLDLLSSMDEFGVIAVDSAPHTIVDLTPISESGSARGRILGIDSMGGGIFVYSGLLSAAGMLQEAKAGTRHIILFADAADAEEPGKYKELLEKCVKANISVSVIGLGTRADTDAAFLEDVAKRGKGRCFFTKHPGDIPRLFAQDTFTVARSAFIDEPVSVKVTAALSGITDRALSGMPGIGGYNLCYTRPDANPAIITVDEYKAPVLAFWQAGKGRVLCYTGEANGKFTGPLTKWRGAGGLFAAMARWTSGEKGDLPENMMVTHELNKGALRIELHLDPERSEEPFVKTPVTGILKGIPGKKPVSKSHTFQWTSPDTLAVEIPLSGSETVLPTIEIPGVKPLRLPPSCLPYSPEFMPSLKKSGLDLAQLAEYSGGKERTNLAEIWEDLPRKPQYREISHFLIIAALVIFLFEILHRRTGFPDFKRGKKRKTKKKEKKKEPRVEAETGSKPKREKRVAGKPVPDDDFSDDEKNDTALNAMQKAREMAKKRMKR